MREILSNFLEQGGEGRDREWQRKRRNKRPRVNKKMIKNFETCYSAVSLMELHYSMLQKNLRFGTSHDAWILVFGVSYAKYLAFDTPDRNALNKAQKTLNQHISNEFRKRAPIKTLSNIKVADLKF